jgi:ubiquinone/menaquinone biosynthesis C-methylase UbiE
MMVAVIALVACVSVCAPREQSVRPGINDPYENANVNEWVERFEGESREIYRQRESIVAALGLKSGQAVADIGAGTGLFVPLLSEAVGPTGHVYAVDIVPEFVRHIEQRAKERGLTNVSSVLCD